MQAHLARLQRGVALLGVTRGLVLLDMVLAGGLAAFIFAAVGTRWSAIVRSQRGSVIVVVGVFLVLAAGLLAYEARVRHVLLQLAGPS